MAPFSPALVPSRPEPNEGGVHSTLRLQTELGRICESALRKRAKGHELQADASLPNSLREKLKVREKLKISFYSLSDNILKISSSERHNSGDDAESSCEQFLDILETRSGILGLCTERGFVFEPAEKPSVK